MNLAEVFNSDELKDYQSLETDDARRLFAQEHFKRDFQSFVYLLGYRDLGEFHKEEIGKIARFRFLESRPVRRLWFWARGFFKTSLITEAHTIWLIVNNPDIRILIVSFSLEVAKKPLGAIRQAFIGNEDFRYFFKEFCPRPNKEGKIEWGTTESLTIPNRTRNLKEPTLMCAGIGTNITGLHFDVMKIDDLVNKDSVTNDVQIQSSKDYYSLLRPIFDNPTIPREDVIGTIYHFNDLHSNLLENPKFDKSVIPVANDKYEFLFPERISQDKFEDTILNDSSFTPDDVQRQYFLRPVNPKDAKFKSEWVNYYDSLPEGLAEYICVDPASTQKKKSDYTVMERWGIDSDGKHYLLDGVRDKFTAFQRIDALFSMVKKARNLKWVKYEVLGGRHGDLEVIKERQMKEENFFFIKETKSTTSAKEDRIVQRLQGAYNAGAIYFPRTLSYRSIYDGKTHNFVEEFKTELLQFPNTIHDDILDCQSQMFEEENIRGRLAVHKVETKWGTANDWDKMYKSLDKKSYNNPFITNEGIMQKIRVKRLKRIIQRA